MRFKENKFIENFWEKIGYLVAYFLFTTMLFLILNISGKVNYFNVMIITLLISLMGYLLKGLLK